MTLVVGTPILFFSFLFHLSDPTEDEKVSLDELQEQIAEIEDYVQSTDVAAMQSTFTLYLNLLVLIRRTSLEL
jgi:hypothetical protein